MGLMHVLSRYAGDPNRPPPQVFEDFDRVAREASQEDLGMPARRLEVVHAVPQR